MKIFIKAFLPWMACVVFLAGCPAPRTGVVVSDTDLSSETSNIAPTIPVQTSQSGVTTLAKMAGPYYVIAFVTPKSDQALTDVDLELEAFAKHLWLSSTDVVQVTQPPEGQSLPTDPTVLSPPKTENVVLLLDPDRLAWRMFRQPEDGSLYLIDKDGYIKTVGSLANPQEVLENARLLSQEWQQDEWQRMEEGEGR